MRVVKIDHSVQKARDTSRVYELTLFDGSERVTIADNAKVVVKVGNLTGFLFDIEPKIVDSKIKIDSGSFSELPPDIYRLEVWITKDDKLSIYPDESQAQIRLNSTLNDVQGTTLSVITIEQLRKEIANGDAGVPIVGPKGDQGERGLTGQDGKSAYQIWLDLGNTGSEQDFIDSLKPKSETGVRCAPTSWTLDRTTKPWTIWLDNGCGLQFPEYETTGTVYGYGFAENLTTTDFNSWPLIPNVIRASRGAITVEKFRSKSGVFDYWSPATKVINPLQDASKFDWSNAFGNAGTNSASYGRKPVFARVMFELGIWSEADILGLGAKKKG